MKMYGKFCCHGYSVVARASAASFAIVNLKRIFSSHSLLNRSSFQHYYKSLILLACFTCNGTGTNVECACIKSWADFVTMKFCKMDENACCFPTHTLHCCSEVRNQCQRSPVKLPPTIHITQKLHRYRKCLESHMAILYVVRCTTARSIRPNKWNICDSRSWKTNHLNERHCKIIYSFDVHSLPAIVFVVHQSNKTVRQNIV